MEKKKKNIFFFKFYSWKTLKTMENYLKENSEF